jgi:hypothetical protein
VKTNKQTNKQTNKGPIRDQRSFSFSKVLSGL